MPPKLKGHEEQQNKGLILLISFSFNPLFYLTLDNTNIAVVIYNK